VSERDIPDSRGLTFRLLRTARDGTVHELGRFASRADAEAVAQVFAARGGEDSYRVEEVAGGIA
jgi:hypothetical protein